MSTYIRLFVSAFVAFSFYASWAWYANSLITSDTSILFKAAIVQGTYSGAITLIFTYLLESCYRRFGTSNYCLAFILPRWSKMSKSEKCATVETISHSIETYEKLCHGSCIPGLILAPVPALLLQSLLVIGINISFSTPNLWPTVIPSIFFSALYGYFYSFGLARQEARSKVTNL
ncbi:hypothetical protein [Glaciecola sp. 1036]|uniref:hypothetical protein n=1 Tax=Alteromonadaceae TaxID=72275 RepID=UPI003D041332